MLNWSTDDSRVSLSGMRWVRSVPRVGRLDVGRWRRRRARGTGQSDGPIEAI